VDELGLGTDVTPSLLTVVDVQSANLGGDTDGDGLDDLTEFLIRSNPCKPDTDGDSLSDAVEWNQWLTSPTSVDSDGDARGPDGDLPPNPALFDGFELDPSVSFRTSPTLADTDGDGKTDFEEIDDPSRSPLIAELPEYTVTQVGNVDLRLNVEYAEAAGTETQYGTEASTSETTGVSRGGSDQWSINSSFTTTLGVSSTVGASAGLTDVSANASATVSSEFSAQVGFGAEHTTTWTQESARTFQEQYSEYVSDSLTRTETSTSGSLSLGLMIENTGLSTFEVTSLGVTVQRIDRDPEPSFRTMATLLPAVNGITLAPGETTGVIQVSDNDLDASLVKDFLASPSMLLYDTSSIELLDAQGINFDFVKENVFPRTALVLIDYGDGRLERFRVATNVARAPDSAYLGVTLGSVMSEILGIDFDTAAAPSTGGTTLSRVEDTPDALPTAKWASFLSSEREEPIATDFQDIVLQPGDEIALTYLYDRDVDGLIDRLEELFGSVDGASPSDADTDGDGLTDFEEVVEGWVVNMVSHRDPESLLARGISNATSGAFQYRVFSDPRTADTDGDGETDDRECDYSSFFGCSNVATDPTVADTDGDGMSDAVEHCLGCSLALPNRAAKILYVDAACLDEPLGDCGARTGESWDDAYGQLRDALGEAHFRQINSSTSEWVNEIWVAQGVYTPTQGSAQGSRLDLVDLPMGSGGFGYPTQTVPVALYGGFLPGATKRSQRVADPLFNATEVSGDLSENDEDNFVNYADNSYNIFYADGKTVLLDGFTISSANAVGSPAFSEDVGGGIVILGGTATLRNLQLRLNHADGGGGAIYLAQATARIENSILFRNQTSADGGAIRAIGSGIELTLTDTALFENTATGSGGGLAFDSLDSTGQLRIQNSLIENNVAETGGGGGVTTSDRASIVDSEMRGNQALGGGAISFFGSTGEQLLVAQSVVAGNNASSGAGLRLASQALGGGVSARILNSSIGGNQGSDFGARVFIFNNLVSSTVVTTIENSILAGNGNLSEDGQILGNAGGSTLVTLRNSCIQGLNQYSGAGNVLADDAFVDLTRLNLRLKPQSVCVDAGSNFIDFDPGTVGFQPLPAFDLDGQPRIVDGDGDGNAVVDTGAYEVQAE